MSSFLKILFGGLAICVVACLAFVMFDDGGSATNAPKIAESPQKPAHSKSFESVERSLKSSDYERAYPSQDSTLVKATDPTNASLSNTIPMEAGTKSQMSDAATRPVQTVSGGSLSPETVVQSSRTAATNPSVVDIPMTAGVPIREITIPVPEGAKVPALFHDDVPKPAPQMKALDKIATEFEKNVSEIPPGMTKEEVWEAARRFADESYLILFGYQAFNQYHIQAAKEALREKRQREQSRGQ
jgi:hypothetical protein